MAGYTPQQWLTLILFSIATFCIAACASLQAPFYPKLAAEKGATPTQYGFVFGVYRLTMFFVSPLYGKYMKQIGPKFMFNAGIFTSASTCILFGFLNRVNGTTTFISISIAIRILEAMGSSGFLTASNSIIAKEFSGNMASTLAALKVCGGLGLIVGPTLGGMLYTLGGYTLPFVVVGSMLLIAAAITYCILPQGDPEVTERDRNSVSMVSLFKIPIVALAAYTVIAAAFGLGFMQALLEPHLRQFELSPFNLTLVFMCSGGAYGISAPLWGWLCDKFLRPDNLVIFGGLIATVSFLLIGPAPFLPISTTLPLCIAALVCHGLGVSAELIANFPSAIKGALANGFPDDIGTYGLVSAIWTSVSSLAGFAGSSAGGVLFDQVGFKWASMLVMGLHFLVVVSFVFHSCCSNGGTKPPCPSDDNLQVDTDTEKTPLLTPSNNSPPDSPSNPDSSNYGSISESS